MKLFRFKFIPSLKRETKRFWELYDINSRIKQLSFICVPCREGDHNRCAGDTWCDCLHRVEKRKEFK